MPPRLRPQQLEARVIELVDLVLAGGRIEDDLVECKSQWPDPQQRSSARQLAGHANKARGEPILWLIGLDENTHTLTQPRPVEVADWWAAVASRFDPPAPELEHHLVIPVGEGQAATALRFLTDRSPYVITGGGENGSLEREVPIRDGTRTRSARRDELLRLLIPRSPRRRRSCCQPASMSATIWERRARGRPGPCSVLSPQCSSSSPRCRPVW